jgi:hypothetical protein
LPFSAYIKEKRYHHGGKYHIIRPLESGVRKISSYQIGVDNGKQEDPVHQGMGVTPVFPAGAQQTSNDGDVEKDERYSAPLGPEEDP